jgi:hypothetical protein
MLTRPETGCNIFEFILRTGFRYAKLLTHLHAITC